MPAVKNAKNIINIIFLSFFSFLSFHRVNFQESKHLTDHFSSSRMNILRMANAPVRNNRKW